MEVKVQCACGTRYKFDVEPVNDQLPGPVSCPTCGADGTAASNAIITQSLTAQLPAVTAGSGPQSSSPEKPRIRLHIPSPGATNSSAAIAPVAQPASLDAVAPGREPRVGRPAAALVQPSAATTRAKGNFGLGILGAVLGTLLSVGISL